MVYGRGHRLRVVEPSTGAANFYERLLASRDQSPVKAEADELTAPLAAENFIRDPYVLEFLDLKNYPALRESDLEQALLDKLQEFLLKLGRGFCFVARQKLMRYHAAKVDTVIVFLYLAIFSSVGGC